VNDENLVQEFLLESRENLEQLDRDLVALETNPGDRDRLAGVFRTMHNLKGACGFFGFARLEAVSHRGENLLSRLRDGKIALRPEVATALLSLVDAVRQLLDDIGRSGREGDRDHSALLASLTALQEGAATPVTRAMAAPEPSGAADTAETTIRVDVGRLDKLMNLVGELVLARNQILQLAATRQDPAYVATAQRLNLITTELQQGVMKTRMQPIGAVWNKLPRLARDLAVACGKQVSVGFEGADTELDKGIMEAIKDPLIHLVRNAVDHGLETPEVRRARGKPAEGRLLLRAFHEGGLVNIEAADDGGGVDPERVKRKALERGLIGEAQAAQLSDNELTRLVFLPGFSTAERVSNVSGRGVGMDVVKTNVEKAGGTVELASRPGLGTTVTIKIPLTLAIIPALIVVSGGERYAIPQGGLLELVRLEEGQTGRGVERIHGCSVYRLRDKLLPLVYLDREFAAEEAPGKTDEGRAINILVLQAGDREFGLVVDGVQDTEEIVVKPLGAHVKNIPLFAGATIMGDGRVVLILDVLGLARRAGVIAETADGARTEKADPARMRCQGKRTLLLLGLTDGRRAAVPLSMVARLEEAPASAAERAGRGEVMQYRGRILPLIRLGEPAVRRDAMQLVICADGDRQAALVVDRIVDVTEAAPDVAEASRGEGTLGSAVIGRHVTDLLDVPGIIRAAHRTAAEPVGRA